MCLNAECYMTVMCECLQGIQKGVELIARLLHAPNSGRQPHPIALSSTSTTCASDGCGDIMISARCPGTTSNEAFHAYLNNVFRQVRVLSKANMELKLRLIKFGTQLAHTNAYRYPTLRQLRQAELLVPSL